MEKKDHEFCLRCGRKLKNPIAREKGYGMICERKLGSEVNQPLFDAKVRSASSASASSPSSAPASLPTTTLSQ